MTRASSCGLEVSAAAYFYLESCAGFITALRVFCEDNTRPVSLKPQIVSQELAVLTEDLLDLIFA